MVLPIEQHRVERIDRGALQLLEKAVLLERFAACMCHDVGFTIVLLQAVVILGRVLPAAGCCLRYDDGTLPEEIKRRPLLLREIRRTGILRQFLRSRPLRRQTLCQR